MSIGDLPPADWAKAQELLLKLVYVLTPLASSASSLATPTSATTALQVTRRIFSSQMPPETAPATRAPLRLLPTLREMQHEVASWIEALKSSSAPEGEGSQDAPVPTASAPRRSEPLPRSASDRPTEGRMFSKVLPPDARPVPGTLASTVRQPAQHAIEEVRSAIRFLTTSSMLASPKKEALHGALQQVKPTLDEVVEKLEAFANPRPRAAELQRSGEGSVGNFRLSLPSVAEKPLWHGAARSQPVAPSSIPKSAETQAPFQFAQPGVPQGVLRQLVEGQPPAREQLIPLGPLPLPTTFGPSAASRRKEKLRRLPPRRENLWDDDEPPQDR